MTASTDQCLESAVRDAADLGYVVTLFNDAYAAMLADADTHRFRIASLGIQQLLFQSWARKLAGNFAEEVQELDSTAHSTQCLFSALHRNSSHHCFKKFLASNCFHPSASAVPVNAATARWSESP